MFSSSDSCEIFSNRLLKIIPPQKIIIHEAYWTSQYYDNDEIKYFDNISIINKNNAILEDYYYILKYFIPSLTVKTNDIKGNAQHAWGLSPFHYTDQYYKDIYNQIQELTYSREP